MDTCNTRPYKVDTPLNTITKIRNIFSNLDCFVYETKWSNPYKEIYSLRIETDEQDGIFGTNGKGRNRLFTVASAYAEFMERLQNGFLHGTESISRILLGKVKASTGFHYYPDEKEMTLNEFKKLPKDFLNDLYSTITNPDEFDNKFFNRLNENGYNGCITVPFYDVNNEKIVYLPYNLILSLTGSNGMSAGNNTCEGVFQGLCEILERYGAALVYFNQITPPTISRDYLAQFPSEYKIICDIEKESDYDVTVKDFSANVNIPVLGVIIKNRRNKKYRLNVGSDTSFSVALSRCLTEIYQGLKNIEEFENMLLPTPEEEHNYFLREDPDSLKKRYDAYTQFTINGVGVFPKSLFNENESYAFNSTCFTTSNSYEKEVSKLLKLIKKLGHNIYIRDVSFLGFPSFYIYIPTMSPLGKKSLSNVKTFNIDALNATDRIEDYFFDLKNLTNEKTLELSSILERYTTDGPIKEVLKLEFYENSDWFKLPKSFIETLLWYKLNEFDKAISSLKIFMKATDNENDEYYNTILAFFKHRNNEKSINIIKDLMFEEKYDENIVFDIIDSFSDKSRLFEQIKLPCCPSCNNCDLLNECQTSNKLKFTIRINNEMKNNIFTQDRLKEHII